MTDQEIKYWILDSPETDIKELKSLLFDMGVVIDESDLLGLIIEIGIENGRN